MKIVSNRRGLRDATLALIQRLTGNHNTVTIPAEFVHYTGTLDCALFLSQMLYWTERTRNPDGWIYKTYKEWKKEIHLSEFEIRKAVKALGNTGKGILETKVKKANGSPTVHYRLLADKFSESFMNFLQERVSSKSINQDVESEESLTETTTKTTSDITQERERLAYASSHSGAVFGGNSDASLESSSFTHTESAGAEIIDAEPVFDDPPRARGGSTSPLPAGFSVTEGMRTWAAENAPAIDVDYTTRKFLIHYEGEKRKDWIKTWQMWVLREKPNNSPDKSFKSLSWGEKYDEEQRRLAEGTLFDDFVDPSEEAYGRYGIKPNRTRP